MAGSSLIKIKTMKTRKLNATVWRMANYTDTITFVFLFVYLFGWFCLHCTRARVSEHVYVCVTFYILSCFEGIRH